MSIANDTQERQQDSAEEARQSGPETPAEMAPSFSAGHLIRDAHRAVQKRLEDAISPRGVARGQWYFLRVLWEGDGLTQRELSGRVGMMEPTTVVALKSMEKAGLIRRERDPKDRRKIHIFLTDTGRGLKEELLPLAKAVNDLATAGCSEEDLAAFRRVMTRVLANLVK